MIVLGEIANCAFIFFQVAITKSRRDMASHTYMTKCSRCQETSGRAHSFELLGTLRDNTTHVFYTSLANSMEPEDSPDTLAGYLFHMHETRPHPWIWILDCRGMKSKDLLRSGLSKTLTEVVQHTNIETLHGVYILHPTMAMNAVIQCIKPFLYKETRQRIHVCSLGLIDTVNRLESAGITRPAMIKITQKLAGSV